MVQAFTRARQPLFSLCHKGMNYLKPLLPVAIIMLLFGIPSMWPYAYYQILRWVVTIAALVGAYDAHEAKRTYWIAAFVAIAILFNPIAPIHLDKITWSLIDLVVASAIGTYLAIFRAKAN